jgi:signal transduction histidine kinase
MVETNWRQSRILGVAALAALVYTIVAAVLVGGLAWRANEVLARRAIDAVENERRALLADHQSGGLPRVAQLIATRAQPGGTALYALADVTGRVIAGNLPVIPDEIASPDVYAVFSASSLSPQVSRLAIGVVTPLSQGHRLLLARDIEDQRSLAAEFRWMLVAALTSLGLLASAAAWSVRRYFTRRLATITQASRAIMVGDLSGRVTPEGTGGEFDALAATLNAMLERIEHLVHALQEVSANIAHDLKTPLNRLRNSAEAALRDPEGAPAYRRGLESAIEEADGLIRTFNALLLIARLEGGSRNDTFEVFDVADVGRDLVELYEPVAEEANVALAAEGNGVVLANRQLVSQAIANLIDNALKYATDDAADRRQTITLSVVEHPDAVEIAVADDGPGIAPGDRARALERFVRLEKSRSRPGSGLGLSLVSAVANLHGGTFRLEDNEPGLRAILSLPRGMRPARAA